MECPNCQKPMESDTADVSVTFTRFFYRCVCGTEVHEKVERKEQTPARGRKVKFELIKQYFDTLDEHIIEKKNTHVFDTSHGIWGCSSLRDTFELFEKIELHKNKHFVDLGSGDGRIALLAALFTKTQGIEGDKEMHTLAIKAQKKLQQRIPEVARCTLVRGNYEEHDMQKFDTFYTYADHGWSETFEKKLMHGTLLAFKNIFAPKTLKKGKTIWIGQTPVVTYHL